LGYVFFFDFRQNGLCRNLTKWQRGDFALQRRGAMKTSVLSQGDVIRCGLLAGAAGGLAEVIWVCLYAVATGGNAAVIARGVTTAAGLNAVLPASPVTAGIFVHMALAVLGGIALTVFWRSVAGYRRGAVGLYAVSIAALAAVWAMNFFIVLPAVSADFTTLMPYWVSLTSKLLFGLSAAETLRRCALPAMAAQPLQAA
jgi:hypothetical protein